jgi:hypothetical protein
VGLYSEYCWEEEGEDEDSPVVAQEYSSSTGMRMKKTVIKPPILLYIPI